MAGGRYTPVIVGVGDIKNKSLKIEDAIEPLQLMLKAIILALKDTGLSPSATKELQLRIDSVSVVNTWTWNYHDLPGLIAKHLGVKPSYKVLSHHGGDSPAKLLDEAARRISLGEAKVAVVTGGEALASRKYQFVMQLKGALKLTWLNSWGLCCCWKAAPSRMDRAGQEQAYRLSFRR